MRIKEDRKQQIVDSAVRVFAEYGYYKATTALVAESAGVTQPYIFHFFKNKEALFNHVIDQAVSRVYDAFMQVEAPADELMVTMGKAFNEIMAQFRDEIVVVMQAHTIPEPSIRDHVREQHKFMHRVVLEKFRAAGIPNPKLGASQFLGMGLLITLAEVLQLDELLCFDK